MIVLDVIYYLLVLWTGVVVSKGASEHEGNQTIVAHILSALLIIMSVKNLALLFLGN